jgi:hypothetical protein
MHQDNDEKEQGTIEGITDKEDVAGVTFDKELTAEEPNQPERQPDRPAQPISSRRHTRLMSRRAEQMTNVQKVEQLVATHTAAPAQVLIAQGTTVQTNLEGQLEAICMAMMSIRKGTQVYGERAREAIEKEMRQLHGRNVFEAIKWHTLSLSQKSKISPSLCFLTEKTDGRVKARFCANGKIRSHVWHADIQPRRL